MNCYCHRFSHRTGVKHWNNERETAADERKDERFSKVLFKYGQGYFKKPGRLWPQTSNKRKIIIFNFKY